MSEDWSELGEQHHGEWVAIRYSRPVSEQRLAKIPADFLMRVELTDEGRLVCTGLVVGSAQREEVTARGLREIPVASILTLLQSGEESWSSLVSSYQRHGWITSGRPIVRTGPKGWPQEHYRRVAESYRQAAQDSPDKPVKRLSEMWLTPNGKPTPEPTIRRWLHQCRALGLLEDFPARPGRPSIRGHRRTATEREVVGGNV